MRALCSVCGGDGVVKIPGGVSTCQRCGGECYEPDRLRAVLARLVRALDAYFAAKGTPDERVWVKAFNELMAALADAKRQQEAA